MRKIGYYVAKIIRYFEKSKSKTFKSVENVRLRQKKMLLLRVERKAKKEQFMPHSMSNGISTFFV